MEPIAEKAKDVDAKCDARLEKLNRLKVAEKDRESLAGAKRLAEAYLLKEDEVRRAQNSACQAGPHKGSLSRV